MGKETICRASIAHKNNNFVTKDVQRVTKDQEANNYYYEKLYNDDCSKENNLVLHEKTKIDGDFINDSAFDIFSEPGTSLQFKFDFVDGIEWAKLADHYEVELEAGASIGYDQPQAGKPNPSFGDHCFYHKLKNTDQLLYISKTGQHGIIAQVEAGLGLQFP